MTFRYLFETPLFVITIILHVLYDIITIDLINFLNAFSYKDVTSYILEKRDRHISFYIGTDNTTYFYYNLSWIFYLISKLKITCYDIISNYLKFPVFIYFFIFFFLTTVTSLIMSSYLGVYGVFILNLFSLFSLWISTLFYIHPFFIDGIFFYVKFGKWIFLIAQCKITFDFSIDVIAFSFILLTITIALFVYTYTFSYFRGEPLVDRLLLFTNAFVISMIVLVSASNLIVLFLGWELIGITSFFLINFWSSRTGTFKSAFKAFSFNKLSDFFLFFAILLFYNVFYSVDIGIIKGLARLYSDLYINFIFKIRAIDLISFFLLGAIFIKSAQIGFHIWLPDSMEAPVPASALIHSATLVSAGIYIIMRFFTFLCYSIPAISTILIIGSMTALYGGLVAMYQSDVKKVLAYSTISNCGFLMVISATGMTEHTILYLYIHGFAKATVFLCMGNVIRFSKNNQDFRRMGLFYKYLPFECIASFICLITLSGIPFTFGYFLKQMLFLGEYIDLSNKITVITYLTTFLASSTSVFYAVRLFYYIFFDKKKGRKIQYKKANRFRLNSKHYTNSSLASNLSILFLIISAACISTYLFSYYFSVSYQVVMPEVIYVKPEKFVTPYIPWEEVLDTSILIVCGCALILFLLLSRWGLDFNRSNYINSLSTFILYATNFHLFYYIIL